MSDMHRIYKRVSVLFFEPMPEGDFRETVNLRKILTSEFWKIYGLLNEFSFLFSQSF